MCISTADHFLPPKKSNLRCNLLLRESYSKRKGKGVIATRQRFEPHEKVGGE